MYLNDAHAAYISHPRETTLSDLYTACRSFVNY
jgi:hypothetical protein